MTLALLNFTDWSLITLGAVVSFAGLGLFYCALKQPTHRPLLLGGAGTLILFAYWPWMLSTHIERTLAAAIALLMTLAITCLGFACQLHMRHRIITHWPDRSREEAISQYGQWTSVRWLVAGPVTLLAALLLGTTTGR